MTDKKLTEDDLIWLPDDDDDADLEPTQDADDESVANELEPAEDSETYRRESAALIREHDSKVVDLDDERASRKPDGSYRNPFPSKNLEAMVTAFGKSGFAFRFNTRSLGIEYDDDGDWKRLDDRYAAHAQEAIGARFFFKTERGPRGLHFGRERWAVCLDAYLMNRQVDPFMDYIDLLPHWDGESRLDLYLADLFGCPDGDLEIWASRYLFVGTIQRTYEPACLLREMPVLIGAQGVGKSALTRCILPPGIPGLHSDGLRWDAQPAQQVDSVRGRAIVEVSEMAGRSRAQIEVIKGFVSRVDDGSVRLPWRRNPDPLPRRYILVGTTNRADDLPNDPSGLSRFVPVILKYGSDVEEFMMDNRTQLWAEALQRYRAGLRANLPRELMTEQAARAEDHRSRDEFVEEAIATKLSLREMTIGEIKLQIGDAFRDHSAHRIGNALRSAGWSKKKGEVDGKRRWVWSPPPDIAN